MINDRLKVIREKAGMNKTEFSRYLGVKYTTYNNYETGAREPSSDFLILISSKMDVSIDYILGVENENKEISNAYKLKPTEFELIKKFRQLDSRGQRMVNIIIDEEWNISQKEDWT